MGVTTQAVINTNQPEIPAPVAFAARSLRGAGFYSTGLVVQRGAVLVCLVPDLIRLAPKEAVFDKVKED